jgi:hypothetical protein
MTQRTKEEFEIAIAELLIEPEDPMNPHLEHNAYNWGLAHATLVLNGGDIEAIRALQPK